MGYIGPKGYPDNTNSTTVISIRIPVDACHTKKQ